MPGTIKYDIFKSDAAGKILHVETIEGLAPATNRIEEQATSDPTFDYYLYCGEAGIVVRLVRRTWPSPVVVPNHASQKKAG
jgi:hypothetical protein